jgi:hypothetical protein
MSFTVVNNKLKKVDFNNVKMEQMSIEDFLQLPEVPMQRNTEGRASKIKVKKMLRILKAPHLEVSLVKLVKDCVYYGKKYKKGWTAIVNGNTRKYYWVNNLTDKIPNNVNATIYFVENMEEVRDIYNMFDNPDSSERNQEKLYGILSGLYNFEPNCSKVIKGEFLTGLHYACYKLDPAKYNQPNIKSENLPFEVKEFIEEIKVFDKICLTPRNWDQALVCAALMSLKRYGLSNLKLMECFKRIDQRQMNTTVSEQDGATHICLEWKTDEKFPSKGTSWNRPNGFSDTVPFALYWIEKFMQDKKQMQFGRGWETTATTWFDEYHKMNNNLNKIFDLTEENKVAVSA